MLHNPPWIINQQWIMEFHWYIHVFGRLVEGQRVLHHYGFEPLWTLGSRLVLLFCSAALGFLSGWGCNSDMQAAVHGDTT